jgi:hypothetical protein
MVTLNFELTCGLFLLACLVAYILLYIIYDYFGLNNQNADPHDKWNP